MNIREMIERKKQENIQRRAEARDTNEQIRRAKVEARKEQQIRLARESEKIAVDKELARTKKYGGGFGGRVRETMAGVKKRKGVRMGMGNSPFSLGGGGINVGVNRSAFELGGSSKSVSSAFSLGGGRGGGLLDLSARPQQAVKPKKKQRSILIKL